MGAGGLVWGSNEANPNFEQVMEFVKGRIITDPDLGELSPSDRRKA